MESSPSATVFLFINDSSGGGVGTKLLMQEIEKVEFRIAVPPHSETTLVKVYLFEMLTKRERGFQLLREETKKGRVVVIVCGGDGTIMWVVSEMARAGVDTRRVALGVIPLGTGNDFSQHLGWGKEKTTLVENGFRSLKKLIRKWLVAHQQQFDLWHVRAEVFENGKFEKVDREGNSQAILKDNQKALSLHYDFCNYFSFGIDGKIGYSFDRRRTKSRMANLVVYGTMGLVKAATRTKTIEELVQSMWEEGTSSSEDFIEPEPSLQKPHSHIKAPLEEDSVAEIKKQKPQQQERKLLFRLGQEGEKKAQQGGPQLKGEYYNMLFLNIDSFMGGVRQIWQRAKDDELGNKQAQFSAPSTADGKAEVVCFGSSVGMAMERMLGGFATKISQSSGPFLLSFRRYQKEEKHRTYLQIDGEFIRFTHPRSVRVSRSRLGHQGRIRVLRRNTESEQQS